MDCLINVGGLLRLPPNVQKYYADDNIVVPFKDRTINFNKPIKIYRNLRKKGRWYSIMQNNKIVAHSTAICIRDAEFIIQKSGKNKAMKTKIRNVHAYIKGMYEINGMGTTAKKNDLPINIIYNPFDKNNFHYIHCNKIFEIKKCWFLIANDEGVKGSYKLK